MLKTAFIGNNNMFDQFVCQWLSEHTDLTLIIWTEQLSWAHGSGSDRRRRICKRFLGRARRKGHLQALDEMAYYACYRWFLQRREISQICDVLKRSTCTPRRPLHEIQQIRPPDIRSPQLRDLIESLDLDAMFAMCIDVYLPQMLIDAPKKGTFLWHEGITPEYRGVYSPFWALAKQDYERLGYTLLKMNTKLDAGDIYVQGAVEGIDPRRDWHSYIGHKAILDSLPKVEQFLKDLEAGRHEPMDRSNAVDGYYSYPRLSSLLKIVGHRWFQNARNSDVRSGWEPAKDRTTTEREIKA